MACNTSVMFRVVCFLRRLVLRRLVTLVSSSSSPVAFQSCFDNTHWDTEVTR